MARKKAKYDWGKGNSRYQKFETRLNLKWTSVDGTDGDAGYRDSAYIDVARCLSNLNRKLVRQGQVFKIKGMRIYTNDTADDPTMVKVGVLPRVWPMFNAYKKARALWNEQNLKALGTVGAGNLPKYYDFKVYMEAGHFAQGLADQSLASAQDTAAQITVCDFEDNKLHVGEWVYSKMHDSGDTSVEHFVHLLGDCTDSSGDAVTVTSGGWSNGSVGAIEAYAASRGLPFANRDATDSEQQTGDMLNLGPWGRLFGDDDQTTDTVDDLTADNDDPPYPRDKMIGGGDTHPTPLPVFYGRMSQRNTNTNQSIQIPTFEAPLGLIRIEADGTDAEPADDWHIKFDVEIMGDM